jgi:hypothetical protein
MAAYAAKTAPKSAKPTVNQALKDAIAIHVQQLTSPSLAGRLTGILAAKAGRLWAIGAGHDKPTVQDYADAAEDMPRFVKWYATVCVGCSPPQAPDKFESHYARYIDTRRPAEPQLGCERCIEGYQLIGNGKAIPCPHCNPEAPDYPLVDTPPAPPATASPVVGNMLDTLAARKTAHDRTGHRD